MECCGLKMELIDAALGNGNLTDQVVTAIQSDTTALTMWRSCTRIAQAAPIDWATLLALITALAEFLVVILQKGHTTV